MEKYQKSLGKKWSRSLMGGGRLREVVAHGEVGLYSQTTTNGHLSTTATLFCPRWQTVHTLTLI